MERVLRTNEPIEDQLGKPAMLRKEDAPAYLDLVKLFERALNPQDLFGKMRVRDLVNYYWEERHLNGLHAALVEGGRPQALAVLLKPFFGDNREEALETAENYYSGVLQRQRSAQKVVNQAGIGPKQIEAKAMQVSGDGVQMIDRMKTNRMIARNALMKELERSQRKLAKSKLKNIQQVSDSRTQSPSSFGIVTKERLIEDRDSGHRKADRG